MNNKVIVIGGGPSGMIAAGIAAKNGADVSLYEKNEKLGKKLYITGKGRCNITNYCDVKEFLNNIIRNNKFMLSALHSFSSYDTYDLIESLGIDLKVERGNRVFPQSDKSSDIIKAFTRFLTENNVKIKLNNEIKDLIIKDNLIKGIIDNENKTIECDKVIVCTGGLSYKATGSTGDGFKWASKLNIPVIDLKPALVPILLKGDIPKKLEGLSLKNVELKIIKNNKIIFNETGEMLFTSNGVSGPIVLTASSYINRENLKDLILSIDLKPYIDENELDRRILSDFNNVINKEFKNSLNDLLPKSIIPIIIEKSKINEYIKVNQITKEQRLNLVKAIKNFEFEIIGLCDFNEAIITSGGIDVNAVNPSTMESKMYKGLYFAGEIIDVDAKTGGFNIQIALSTGYLAGLNSSK